MSKSKFCPSCGQAVTDTDKFCQHCGAKLEQGYSRTASKKPLDKKWIIFGAIVLVLPELKQTGNGLTVPLKMTS